jgi:hypothetical protein
MTPEEAGDFFEEDEPLSAVIAKFEAGRKGVTAQPADVARVPSATQVARLIDDLVDGNPLESEHDRLNFRDAVQDIIADAMDCVYKNAVSAPPSHGSRWETPVKLSELRTAQEIRQREMHSWRVRVHVILQWVPHRAELFRLQVKQYLK